MLLRLPQGLLCGHCSGSSIMSSEPWTYHWLYRNIKSSTQTQPQTKRWQRDLGGCLEKFLALPTSFGWRNPRCSWISYTWCVLIKALIWIPWLLGAWIDLGNQPWRSSVQSFTSNIVLSLSHCLCCNDCPQESWDLDWGYVHSTLSKVVKLYPTLHA